MTATNFDTLAYAGKLQEAGFTEDQAEAQAEALRSVIDTNLATKQDLKELESRITLRLGGLIVAGVGVLAVLMRLLSTDECLNMPSATFAQRLAYVCQRDRLPCLSSQNSANQPSARYGGGCRDNASRPMAGAASNTRGGYMCIGSGSSAMRVLSPKNSGSSS